MLEDIFDDWLPADRVGRWQLLRKVVREVIRKDFRRVLSLIAAVAVAVGLTMPAVYAASGFDKIEKGTVTVNIDSKVPVREGIAVKVYKVADAAISGGYVSYTKTALFEPDSEWMGDVALTSTETEWPERAKTLAGYAAKEGFADRDVAAGNYWTQKTDANGSVKLEGLSKGLYLVTVESVKSGRTTYTFTPALRCLPSLSEDGSAWEADQIVNPKVGSSTSGGGGSSTSITAIKVWKESAESQQSDRPDSITVELLRDGKVYASQSLSKSNNWRYTWTGLAKGNTWTVNEVGAVSDKYTVTTEATGNVYTVTNTHTTDIPDEDPPKDDTPGGDDPGKGGDIPPTNIDDPEVPLDPGTTPDNGTTTPTTPADKAAKLPQTGQLWWPVPILAIAGIALFSTGWLRSRKEETK